MREALAAAAACAVGAVLFVAPWRPNAKTVLTAYPPGPDIYGLTDSVMLAHAYREGARNLAGLLRPDGEAPRGWFGAPFLRPLPTPLATMDHRFSEQVWAAPIFLHRPPLEAFGWLVLASLWTTALAAYAMGRLLTGSPWGGAASAVLHGFGALRASTLPHAQIFFFPWLPLWFAALVLFVERPGRQRGMCLAALSALVAVENSYAVPHTALLLALALAVAVARGRVPARAAVGVALGAALLAAPILVPFAVRYAALHAATGLERGDLHVALASADLFSWLTTAGGTLLVPGGPIVERQRFQPMGFLFPGLVVVGLAAAGARALGRRAPEAWVVGAGAFALTLGTGHRLLWSLGLPPLPVGPYALLRLLPWGRAFANPPTAAAYASVALGAAGSWAVAALVRRGAAGRAAACALLALSFLEARASVREIAAPTDPAFEAALEAAAGLPGPTAGPGAGVAVLPMGLQAIPTGWFREVAGLRIAAVHGRPTPNGATAMIFPWIESIAAHLDRPGPGVADRLLRALGVGTVIATDEATAEGLERCGLRRVRDREAGGAVVLALDGAADPAEATLETVRAAMADAPHPHATRPGPARIVVRNVGGGPVRLAAGAEVGGLPLVVENLGDLPWCAEGSIFPAAARVVIGVRAWTPLDPGLPPPVHVLGGPLSGSGALPHDVAPGETAVVFLHGQAPVRPGRYRIAIDLHIDGVGGASWFAPADSALAFVEAEVI